MLPREEHLDQRGRRVNLAGICGTVGFDGRSEAWQAVSVPDLAEADPQDRVFALDPETGQARFGDGAHGLRPPADSNSAHPARTDPPDRGAEGWFAVELRSAGERLVPLLGWALVEPYFPPYRNGNEPAPPKTTASVRGLIAGKGEPVQVVDELSALFGGYRQA